MLLLIFGYFRFVSIFVVDDKNDDNDHLLLLLHLTSDGLLLLQCIPFDGSVCRTFIYCRIFKFTLSAVAITNKSFTNLYVQT